MKFGLKHKAYAVAALTMLVVLGASSIVGQSYLDAERQRVLDDRKRLASVTAERLDHLLGRGLARLEMVASLPALAYGLHAQQQSREGKQIPAWTTLHYLFFESDIFTGGVSLLDLDGRVLWSEPSDPVLLDSVFRDWARVRERIALSPDAGHLFLAPSPGDGDVLVVVPLVGQQGERVGALVGAIPTTGSEMEAVLSERLPSSTGSTHVVDATGLVVGSTDPTRRGERLPYWTPSDVQKATGVEVRLSGANEILTGVASVPTSGWSIFTEERAVDALADVQSLLTVLTMGRLTVVVALGGLLLFVVTGFTGPVSALTAAARRTRAGDLETEFRLDRTDELGELAAALHEMTRNLQEQKVALSRTSALAEAASRAKTEFLAKVSHEIRTPINGVLGMTELLLDTSLSDEQRQLAGTAHQSATSLLSLVNDILDFSRLEAGNLPLRRVVFTLRSVVDGVVARLREQAGRKGLQFTSELHDVADAQVRGDASRVGQVLANLVDNAIKFTDQGQVTIRLRAVSAPSEGCRVRIEVEDTGIGLDRASQARVFEAFVQHDNSATRLYGGNGLGLSLARALTTMMGGECGVESELGRGSLFWFELPLEYVAAAPPTTTVEAQAPRRRYRVLLAEDSPVNVLVAESMLARLKCDVTTVSTGREAVTAFEQGPFDLVLMDLQMPEMGGEDATRAIRRLESGRSTHVPVVAITASALPGDRQVCLEAGMDELLTKPFTVADLSLMIERFVLSREAVS